MTTANGHAPTLDSVRDEYRRERLSLRLAEARVQRQLIESWCLPPGANGWGGPWGHGPGGDGWISLGPGGRVDDRRRGSTSLVVQTEEDLDRVRGQARLLAERNPIALGAIRTLRNFTIRAGYKYRTVPEPEAPNPKEAKELAAQVQVCIDEFVDVNEFPMRQKVAMTRSVRDGEVFWRYFDGDHGMTHVRAVEPEQVRRPSESQESAWSWGKHTDPDDVETTLEYAVHPLNGGPVEFVPADQIDHYKRNVDETVKRGLSDFYAVGDGLDGVLKLLRNMRVGEGVRAAITGFWEYDTANRGQVEAAIAASRDVRQPGDSATGRPQNYQHYEAGTILHTPRGRKFAPPPANQAIGSQTGVVQACLRSIGIRWSMPEYMISGDASNNAYSSSLVAGSPFVVAVETEQDEFRQFFLKAIWRAIRNFAAAGRFWVGGRTYGYEEVMAMVQVECELPQVANVDRLQRSQVKEIELRNGITSKQQWRGEAGYDSDRVRDDLAEEPVQQGTQPLLPGLAGNFTGDGPSATTPAPSADSPASAANDLRATVGGSQAVAQLQRSYYSGELPRVAAVANARLVFGFSATDAEALFPATAPVKLTPDATVSQEGRRDPFVPRLLG